MISVCLASYNGERHIREQIDSILLQLNSDDELIVSDDNSTDDTLSLVAAISDSRIKVLENKADNLGVVKNFEKALSQAKGDYIFLSDQDDIWLPNKISVCASYLQSNLLVVTDCSIVDEELNTISSSFFEFRDSGSGVFKNIWKNTYLGCCIALKRELLEIALPIPNTIPMHDMWLGLLANINGDVTYINKKLSLYRRHELATSATGFKSNFGIMKQIWLRAILAWHLLHRILCFKIKKNKDE